MQKNSNKKRGVSLVRLVLIIAIIIALLIFFNATSLVEIKNLFVTLGQGIVALLKVVWYQLIMPVVSFFLTVLGRVIHR